MQTAILIVGVGGQGTLLTGKILGEYARLSDLDAKVSEVHGMAQRGGCVVTHVKIAEKVYSPLIEASKADALLSFEPVEALRWIHMLKPDGLLVSSSEMLQPLSVTMGNALYPEDYQQRALQRAGCVRFTGAGKLAQIAGTARAANVVLLGVLTHQMGLCEQKMRKAIESSVKPEFVCVNEKAFTLGLQAARATN